jgi:hypothetical protein
MPQWDTNALRGTYEWQRGTTRIRGVGPNRRFRELLIEPPENLSSQNCRCCTTTSIDVDSPDLEQRANALHVCGEQLGRRHLRSRQAGDRAGFCSPIDRTLTWLMAAA